MCLVVFLVLHLSGEIESIALEICFPFRCAMPSTSLKSPKMSILKPLKESFVWWCINFYIDELSSTENLGGQVT